MNMLILILMPLFAALGIVLAGRERAYGFALFGTLAPLAWFLGGLAGLPQLFGIERGFNWMLASEQLAAEWSWFPELGLKLSLGADVVTMLLVALTVLLGPIMVAASKTAITHKVKTYYAWLLVLQGAMTGVFFSRDILLFYIFFEFTLVPMYILINLFGSTNRRNAATKFFLYTFTGSLITLAGIVYVVLEHARANNGEISLAFAPLFETARSMSFSQQAWVFWALLAGFAVKVPLFPVHTWLPLAHTEAPTAGSVVLAGVLLKLGTYGIYRFVLEMTPAAATFYAPTVAVLSIIGIIYAGLICWVQTDVKKLVAYSSVSHLGFCVLGLFALSPIGLSGSVLYMINHGLSTGALFLLIGMIYERYHTRDMRRLGGLAGKMPVWATFMVFFTMASVGLPGLNGFVSEFMCLLAAFHADSDTWGDRFAGGTVGPLGPWYAAFAGVGMIVTAMYLLYMVGLVVFGTLREPADTHAAPHDEPGHEQLPTDLNSREIAVLAPLAVLCVALGLFPTPVLRSLEAPTQQLAQRIQRGSIDALPGPLQPESDNVVPASLGPGDDGTGDDDAGATNWGSGR